MSRRRAVGWAAALALTLTAGALALTRERTMVAPARARALELHHAGLDALFQQEHGRALELFASAYEADPSYFAAFLDLSQFTLIDGAPAAYDRFLRLDLDPALRRCIEARREHYHGRWVRLAVPARLSTVADDCALHHWLYSPVHPAEAGRYPSAARELWERHPSFVSGNAYLQSLAYARRWPELLEAADRLAAGSWHPLIRATARAARPIALHGLGRDPEALAEERRADPLVRTLPAVHLRWQGSHELFMDGSRPLHAHHVEMARRAATWAQVTGGDSAFSLSAKLATAARLLNGGDLADALQLWNELVEIGRRRGSAALLAETLRFRGRLLVKLGRLEDAERDLLEARAFARLADDGISAFEVEHNLLHLYEAAGRFDEARRAGEAFVRGARGLGLVARYVVSLRDLALMLQRQGMLDEARALFAKMVAAIDSLDDQHHWAGEYYEMIGDFDQALAQYGRVPPEYQERIRTLASLVRIAEATGDLALALSYAREHDGLLTWQSNPEAAPLLPGLLARSDRVEEGRREFEKARAAATRRGQIASWADLSLELATLELHAGAASRAAALADSAAAAAARVAATETELRSRALAASASLRTARSAAQSVAELRALAERARTLGMPQLEAELYGSYADALVRHGSWSAGLAAYARTARLHDSVAGSLSLDPARAGFRAAQRAVWNRAHAALLAHAPAPEFAPLFWEWSVRRKARAILDDGAGPTPRRGEAPTLRRVVASLEPDRALLDYIVLDSVVAVLVITSTAAEVRELAVSMDTLRARVRALRAPLEARIGSEMDLGRAAFPVEAAHALYRQLLEPILPQLEQRSRLTIVPDGVLHLIPFDALPSRITRTPAGAVQPVEFVLDRFSVDYALSPSSEIERRSTTRLERVVAFAVDGQAAPEAEREIGAIAAAVGADRTLLFRGAAATEEQVRLHAPTAALLHFAAHARPNDEQPRYARLALSPSNGDDGLLHAFEIAELRLPGTLVVLSGCDTQAGRLLDGEGVLSLSRSFLRAGASATVATLWPVGAATADLMEVFYRELARGAAPAEALRTAKLTLRHGRYANPFYWAPFTFTARGL